MVQQGVATSDCFGIVCVGVCDDLLYGVRGVKAVVSCRLLVANLCHNQQLATSDFSGGIQGDDGDFGGAVEPEGQAYGADTAVDVELHLVEAVVAFGILQAHWWQDKRTDKREPDLAAVGVAGQHEVDERTSGVGDDVVGVVGFVGHQNHRSVRFGGDGEIEVRVAGAGIFDAAEPEAGSSAFDGEVLVDENGGAVGGEGLGDQGAVEGDVVVAEDGVAEGCGEGGEDLGAAVSGVAAGDKAEGAVGDEVAGEENEIGGEGVDVLDDVLEEVWLGVLVEVDVADLDDAIAVEGGG